MLSDTTPKYESKYRKFIILLLIFQLLIGQLKLSFHPEDTIRFYFNIEDIIATSLLIILYFIDVSKKRKFNIQNKNLIQHNYTKQKLSFATLIDIFILACLIYNIYLLFSIFI